MGKSFPKNCEVDPMIKSEILEVSSRIDREISQWMGKRKKVSKPVLDSAILAICTLEKLAGSAPEFNLPERAPYFLNGIPNCS